MKTKISILGSTGSIGSSAVSLLENELKNSFEVDAISFHFNAKLALKQAISLNVKKIIATSKEGFSEIQKLASGLKVEILFGKEALKGVCQNPETEVVLLAIVGVCGLEFALESILGQEKRILAIANKESIICGYHLISEKLKNSNTKIIPVDSEHNSLFRLLKNFQPESIKNVFITASGGPFVGRKFHTLKDVSIAEVVKHPTWNMGSKISVDSATMANKGLELIESHNLFNLENCNIEAFIAKGSLLHAGLNLKDGSSIWFLSNPDMRNHIAHAISNEAIFSLNIPEIKPTKLEFATLEKDEFPIFFIAKDIAERKDTKLAISFNILNEIAVAKFLKSEIKYTEILDIIENYLTFNPENFHYNSIHEIEELFSILEEKLTQRKLKAA